MTSGDKLLLFCLNTGNDAAKAEVLSKWTVSDWNDLVRQSVNHGVSPYLYHRLKTLQPAADIPADVERNLKRMTLHSASRNMRLYHELGKVFSALRNDGIPVVALKGVHLAEWVYGNIALRPMTDVDLLIMKKDLSSAADVLKRSGYSTDMPVGIEPSSGAFRHLPDFTKADSVSIEIHHSIINPGDSFHVDMEALWNRARPALIAGVEVLVLPPEDLLLYLCLHTAYHHRFASGFRALCDIIEIFRNHKIEMIPEQVVVRARQWKAERTVFFTLYLLRELLGKNLADVVFRSLEPGLPDSALVNWAKEQIFFDSYSDRPMSPNLARMWKARGIHDKAAALFKYVFVSRNVMAAMYPAPPDSMRMYFYYCIRIGDVLKRYGSTVWQLLLRNKKSLLSVESEEKGNALEQWMTMGVDQAKWHA